MNISENQTTKMIAESRPLRFSEAGQKTLGSHTPADTTANALAEIVHAMRLR